MHIFIISWASQHKNAVSIARKVQKHADFVSIIYSDPNPMLKIDVDCDLIRRPDNLFWGDKFKSALDACKSDLMLVIHADCQCDNWPNLVRKCVDAYQQNQEIAVWSPLITGSAYPIQITKILHNEKSPLHVVAQTDGIVFCLSRHSQERMRAADYSDNIYGWGITWLFASHAFSTHKLVVVDSSVLVKHSKGCGYDQDEAFRQRNLFLSQLTPPEIVQFRLLSKYIDNQAATNKKA